MRPPPDRATKPDTLFFVIPGRPRRDEPGTHIPEACVHGFRARRWAAPRNDELTVSAPSYAWDFWFLWAYRWLILWGLGVTILYTIGTILLGLVIGLATGLLRLSRNKLLTAPLVAYVEI